MEETISLEKMNLEEKELNPILLLGVLREKLQKMGAKVSVHKHPIGYGIQLTATILGIDISVINDLRGGDAFMCGYNSFEALIDDGDAEGWLTIDEILQKVKEAVKLKLDEV